MDLNQGETIIFQGHPSWRSIIGFYIKGLLVAIVVGAAAAGVSKVAEDEVKILWIVVAVVVVMLLSLLVGWVKRLSTEYTITTFRIHVRHGLLNRETEETRIARVQNTTTNQSLIERMLGIGTVDFDVANDESEGLFRMAGVTNPKAIVTAVDRTLHDAATAQPGSQQL